MTLKTYVVVGYLAGMASAFGFTSLPEEGIGTIAPQTEEDRAMTTQKASRAYTREKQDRVAQHQEKKPSHVAMSKDCECD
ncbi:MAG: hypothetical protein ACOY3I_09570 [Verrucomicrobiota bacterium]